MRIENSFIPVGGVGEKTERDLWRRGVTHWDAFDPSYVGATTGERIGAYIEEARSRLAAGDARYFGERFPSGELWRCYENFRDDAAFFDIETTGLSADRDEVTTVSVHRGGDTTTLVRGDDLTRENVARLLDAPLLVTFNGASFDVPFLESAFDLDIDAPHLDSMYAAKKVGLSGGLKAIEPEVGIERDRPDITGRDAVRLWREHERGKDGSLETLVSYNREDAVNLRTLMDEVAGRLHADVFEPERPDTGDA
ncbi:ribonuclease H-like domain-containing protein [Halosegnis marinus]|uniref:Ribonuclease H-like domain-containing protein n=1 Tax=Halosegnis marinus TaxID=3034023 RepID=A0ABD5ZMY2_9EURY|nr:ribonuclease H-like domain-containing protein [Halosegnis sp. DT85]